ncbi:hypothetical protein ASG22_09260 [Chryseobacterium sp. Leaf405]|uniref:hypothetical protein n=1 Tax=Chryseobacterium sp. Leaf405 TaxID=1736367 RepID=UPI0006FD8C8F|nr:hypothetical protein [Chryseobacterium sp. Leaf405]KQT24193.1 hypothetical protein ASG22_09260 [Chryseobacterium sp. Leaf405]
MKKIVSIGIVLISQILFSQIVIKVKINKNHTNEVYSNESLRLILDKTDSTFTFISLPPLDGGDLKIYTVSEGKYTIYNNILTLFSQNKNNFDVSLFDDITGLKFIIKRKKIVPKSDMYYPFSKELIKSKLSKYKSLLYN